MAGCVNLPTSVLSLDLATNTGWAACDGLGNLTHGSVRFSGNLSEFAHGLSEWLDHTIKSGNFDLVVVEAPVPVRGLTRLDTLLIAHGGHMIARLLAYRHGVDFVAINVATWRKSFVGFVRAPADIRGKSARRKWIKQAVIDECVRRGWSVTSDDEADALGVLACTRAQIRIGSLSGTVRGLASCSKKRLTKNNERRSLRSKERCKRATSRRYTVSRRAA